jgi:hypothetical protein
MTKVTGELKKSAGKYHNSRWKQIKTPKIARFRRKVARDKQTVLKTPQIAVGNSEFAGDTNYDRQRASRQPTTENHRENTR